MTKHDSEIRNIYITGISGVLDQGGPSTEADTYAPAYRGRLLRRDPIGHCISDRKYRATFEGLSVRNPAVLHALGLHPHLTPEAGLDALVALQEAHDEAFTVPFMEAFAHDALNAARRHGIELPSELVERLEAAAEGRHD